MAHCESVWETFCAWGRGQGRLIQQQLKKNQEARVQILTFTLIICTVKVQMICASSSFQCSQDKVVRGRTMTEARHFREGTTFQKEKQQGTKRKEHC